MEEPSSKLLRSGDLLFRRVGSAGELVQSQLNSNQMTMRSSSGSPTSSSSLIHVDMTHPGSPSKTGFFNSQGASGSPSPRHQLSSSANNLSNSANNNNNSTCCTMISSRWTHMSWKSKVMAILICAGLVGLTLLLNSNGSMLVIRNLLRWVQSIGWWGNLMFVLMFLLVSFPVILGGYIPLTLGAGAIYGVLLGTVTVSVSSTFGACVAFWICRYTFRDWAERTLRDTREFRFFTRLIQSREHRLVSYLTRLSPIPFGLQNSFFALTDISFRDYMLSTWIGLLPFQVVWTQMGTTLRNLSKIGNADVELDFWQKVSVFVQVVVSVLLMGYFYYISKKIKREEEEESVELLEDVELGDQANDLHIINQEMYKDDEDISHLHLMTGSINTDPDRIVIEMPNTGSTVTVASGGR